jgi:hypothetical protein
MKNVKDVIKNLIVSGKKFVVGANLVALTAFFAPVNVSAADKADSEEKVVQQEVQQEQKREECIKKGQVFVGVCKKNASSQKEKQDRKNKLEQLGYICEDDDCKTCIAVDCASMDDFCIKPCEDVLLKNEMDPAAYLNKAKEQKLAVIQRTFNANNR